MRIEMLGAAGNLRASMSYSLSFSLMHLARTSSMYFSRSRLFLATCLRELVIHVRMKIAKAEILELHLEPADAQAIGDRRVNVESFLRDHLLLERIEMLERAHIVSRSESLTRITRMSLAMARIILRKFSACFSSEVLNVI